MKQKTGKKLLGVLLALAMVLGLMPGMSLTAYAGTGDKFVVTISGNGKQMPAVVESPQKFSCDGHSFGDLDMFILQLYNLNFEAERKCVAAAPTVTGGSGAVTAGLEGDYQYIQINQRFEGTVTVSGKYNNGTNDFDYSLSLSCSDYTPATGVSLSPNTDQTIDVGEIVAFTASVTPGTATQQMAKVNVSNDSVKVYSDEECRGGQFENGATVPANGRFNFYAKGEAAGTATVTVTCIDDENKTASCDITVNASVEYPLWVGGKRVTSANKNDVLGNADEGATVTYTPASGTTPATLTLNEANITTGYPDSPSTEVSGIYYEGEGALDIVLAEGSDNSIEKTDGGFGYGIHSKNPNAGVTISGTGTLTVKGSDYGIKAENNVTINGGNVSVEVLGSGISAANDVTIKGGTVNATATYNGGSHGIFAGKNVAIEGGNVTASATGDDSDGIKAYEGIVNISGGNVIASGKTQAIVGNVKNSIAGIGWTDTAGTEGEAEIAVNTTGQTLSYKKVQFTAVAVHTHSFTYSAEGATITAKCDGSGTCDITEGLALTISAPAGDLVYDGTTTFPATLSEGYNTTAFPGTYSVSYTKDGSAYDGEPREAGSYTASVTVGEGDGAATASVSYVVTAPTHAVTAKVVPEGAGTVALDAVEVAEGATAGIEATPAEGYEFAGWTVDGAGAKIDDAASPKATLTMGTADATVTANFKKKEVAAPDASVTAHVQRIGWMDPVTDGTAAGTTGKSRRMEALALKLPDGVAGGIEYRGHVQRSGWEKDWKADGAQSGTTGKSRRVEAVQIRLTGEAKDAYDVYYRVHVQRYGWMGWAKNGEEAGTQGMSRRAEAIQVVLVKKDAPAPDATYKGVTQQYAKAFVKK